MAAKCVRCLWKLIFSRGDLLSRARSFPRKVHLWRRESRGNPYTADAVHKQSVLCPTAFEIFCEKRTTGGEPCPGENAIAQLPLAVGMM